MAVNVLRRSQSLAEAMKLVDAGKSPRSKELERLQAFVEGTQYDGRPLYLDFGCNLPRWERKPCVIYPLARAAIESNTALAMGGLRFPRILSLSSEDDSDFAGAQGLSPDDSAKLDAFNGKLIDICGLAASFRQAYRMAQGSRSVALIGCYRSGLPTFDPVWAKLCEPTFVKGDPTTVASLEIRYRRIEYQYDPNLAGNADQAGFLPVCKEYRRVIDDVADTVFVEREVWDITDQTPTQQVATRIEHGFGFCPVRWYARQRPSLAVGTYDGIAVHDGRLSELDAINHALSSRHLAAMYTGDPIKCATGADASETFGTVGRAANPALIDPTQKTGWEQALTGGHQVTAVIKAGPGELWRMQDPQGKFYYLALPKGALDALDNHIDDLCSKTREALRYVWIDPEKLTGSGDVSGKTLAFVFSSQINAVSEDRDDFARQALMPTLGMLYRMMVKKPAGLYVPGLKKVLPILQRFLVKLDNGVEAFIAPQLQPKWGEFFDPSDTDEATRCSTAQSALDAGIITKKTAVEHVREVFAISNVDQYVDQLQKETDVKQANAIKNAQDMVKANGAAIAAGPPGAAKPAVVPVAPSKGAQQTKSA